MAPLARWIRRSVCFVAVSLVGCGGGPLWSVAEFGGAGQQRFADAEWDRVCSGADTDPLDPQAPLVQEFILEEGNAGRLDVLCSRVDRAPLALSWTTSGLLPENIPDAPLASGERTMTGQPTAKQPLGWSDGPMPKRHALHRPDHPNGLGWLQPSTVPGVWQQNRQRHMSDSDVGTPRTFGWLRFLDRARFEKEFGPLLLDEAARAAAKKPANSYALLIAPFDLQRELNAELDAAAPSAASTGNLLEDFEAIHALAERYDQACRSHASTAEIQAALAERVRAFGGFGHTPGEKWCGNLTREEYSEVRHSVGAFRTPIERFARAGALERQAIVSALPRAPGLAAPLRARLQRVAAEDLLAEAEAMRAPDPWGSAGRAYLAFDLLAEHHTNHPAFGKARALVEPIAPTLASLLPRGEGIDELFEPKLLPIAAVLSPDAKRLPRSGPQIAVAAALGPRSVGAPFTRRVAEYSEKVVEAAPARTMIVDADPAARGEAEQLLAELEALENEIAIQTGRLGYQSGADWSVVQHQPSCGGYNQPACQIQGGGPSAASTWIRMDAEQKLQELLAARRAKRERFEFVVSRVGTKQVTVAAQTRVEGKVTYRDERLVPMDRAGTLSATIDGAPFESLPVSHHADVSDGGPAGVASFEAGVAGAVRSASAALSLRAQRRALESTAAQLEAKRADDARWFRVLVGLPAPETRRAP